ncbi:MAG TPA: sigma-70 family RNA polymerase sigma factor [Verrucomicrobiae bacterium]|nr:sigma-70 family RNA polymerase sigma factor [Verrucomicrobiae bacterium]
MVPVDERERLNLFEQTVLPHLDAAYNLARWLAGNDHDAQDVAQEATLRAFRFFGNFRGENARAWLLTIVRNTFYTWLRKNRPQETMVEINDETLANEDALIETNAVSNSTADAELVRQAIAELPVEFREIVVLREMEGFSYKEIAELADVPIGTVMSRLARARKLLQHRLAAEFKPGGPS